MPGSRDIRAGGAFVEFTLRRKNLERSLRQIGRQVSQFGARLNRIGATLSAVGGSIAAPFAAALGIFAKVGDSLDKMSKRTGVSVESLSALGFAAEQNGSSLATLEKGIRTMQRSIVDLGRGLSTQRFVFDELGLAFRQLDGLSPEEQFKLIADRIASVEDPTRKAALALQLFGRSGQELVPLLSGGAAGIEAFRLEAERLGIVIDSETASGAAAFTDALNRMRKQVIAGALAIGATLAPTLTEISSVLTGAARSVIDFIKQNAALVQTVAAVGIGLLTLGAAFVALGVSVGLAGFAFTALAGLVAAVLSPLGLAVAAIVAAGVAMGTFANIGSQAVTFLRDRFGELLNEAKRTFGGIADALAGGNIELAARILWASLQLVFFQGVQGLIEQGIKLKAGVLKSITETTLGAIQLGSELFAGLQRVWVKLTSGFKAAWANIYGDAAEAFNLIRNLATKVGNEIRGVLDSDFDVAAANQQADDKFTERQQSSQRERRETLSSIEQSKRDRLDAIEEERKARQAAIAEALEDELAAIRAGQDAEAQRLRDRIAELRRQREELLKQAEAIDRVTPGRASEAPAFDPDIAAGIGDQLRRAAGALGVTSSFDIRSVGGLQTKTLEDLGRQQVRELKKVNQQLAQPQTGNIRIA